MKSLTFYLWHLNDEFRTLRKYRVNVIDIINWRYYSHGFLGFGAGLGTQMKRLRPHCHIEQIVGTSLKFVFLRQRWNRYILQWNIEREGDGGVKNGVRNCGVALSCGCELVGLFGMIRGTQKFYNVSKCSNGIGGRIGNEIIKPSLMVII